MGGAAGGGISGDGAPSRAGVSPPTLLKGSADTQLGDLSKDANSLYIFELLALASTVASWFCKWVTR